MTATWVAIGMGSAGIELARTDTVILSGDATVRISGRVLKRERDERGRYRYTIAIEGTERPVLTRPPGRARILVSSRHEPLPIGGTYRGLVRLRPPAGPAYPGAYDFAFSPYFDGLGAYGFSLGAPQVSTAIRPPTFADRVARLRLAMDEQIRAVLPGATGAVASALITGERAGIPDEIEDALRATSLAHVLSISGFHMALVAGFTMLLVRLAIAGFPAVALRFSSKKTGAVAALGVSAFYFLLSGDNAATERSFVMLAIMLTAILVDRPALTLRNVAIAALVVMALSPHAVLTATFQMSFAATAALIGAYGAYARWQTDRARTVGGASSSRLRSALLVIAGLALSSVIAGAATAPYGVFHFQRAAPFGLVANVLATPIFSFWIMPLALLAAMAMPFGAEALFLHPMGWGLDAVFRLATVLARWLPDQAVGQISVAALVLFTASIIVVSFAASAARWLAIPVAVAAFAVSQPSPSPELLIFEDGREVALGLGSGNVAAIRDKPNAFVWDQWRRAFGWNAPIGPVLADEPQSGATAGPKFQSDAAGRFRCEASICRAVTPSGLRVAWTDDYEKLGEVCDTADIAIVARAVRLESCRSGAMLITLRTLRRSGALAFPPITSTRVTSASIRSIAIEPDEWNAHRLAPWPEFWRNPVKMDTSEPSMRPSPASTMTPIPDGASGRISDDVSGSDESIPPASPEP